MIASGRERERNEMNLNLHKKSIRYKNIIKKVKLIQLCGDKFVFFFEWLRKKCFNFRILMMGGTDEEKLCLSPKPIVSPHLCTDPSSSLSWNFHYLTMSKREKKIKIIQIHNGNAIKKIFSSLLYCFPFAPHIHSEFFLLSLCKASLF